MKPLVYILLSTYNGSQYLPEFLASLEAQTYRDWNLIIRDDGSTDSTLSILREFQQRYPYRAEVIQDGMNIGAKASFGKLIKSALQKLNWEHLMFADQDDVWQSDKVTKTLEKTRMVGQEYPDQPLLIHSDLGVANADLDLLHSSFWKYQNIDPTKDSLNRLLLHNTVTGCTMMINRLLAEKVRNIPDEAIMHDWWIAMVASEFGYIGYINEALILYRQHGKNDTGAKQYGLRYFWNTFLTKVQSGHYGSQLEKYILQVESFLKCYREELKPEQIEMLEAFSKLQEKSWIARRWVLIRYDVFKNGWIRNIGLMVFV